MSWCPVNWRFLALTSMKWRKWSIIFAPCRTSFGGQFFLLATKFFPLQPTISYYFYYLYLIMLISVRNTDGPYGLYLYIFPYKSRKIKVNVLLIKSTILRVRSWVISQNKGNGPALRSMPVKRPKIGFFIDFWDDFWRIFLRKLKTAQCLIANCSALSSEKALSWEFQKVQAHFCR